MTHAIVLVSPTIGSGSFLLGGLIQVGAALAGAFTVFGRSEASRRAARQARTAPSNGALSPGRR